MKKIFFSVIITTFIFLVQAEAASVAGTVEKGNRLYQGQRYAEAAKCYDQALAKQPDSAVINFDAGAGQYKIKEYQKANSYFEKSLITEDKGLEARANYNLGNSKYMLGLSKENTDLSMAVRLLEGTLNNYQRTRELSPQDEDVKVNYKIVQEKLKELREKLKQQAQENKNNQKQQEQDKEQGQNQQGEPPRKEEKPSEQEKSVDRKASQNGQEKQEQSAASQAQEAKEMSKQEADMLLEGYRQEENTTGMLKDDQKGAEEKVLKDW